MPAFKWIKEGSFTTVDGIGIKAGRRVGTLTGFTPTDPLTAQTEAIAAAQSAGGAAHGDAFPGDTSGAVVIERTATPWDNQWLIAYDYKRPTVGGGTTTWAGDTGSLYAIAEDRTLVTVERVRLPHVDSGLPIYVGWENPDDANQRILPQIARIRYDKPAMQETLAGYFSENPQATVTIPDPEDPETTVTITSNVSNFHGYVNSEEWRGYGKGYCLFAGTTKRRNPKASLRFIQHQLLSLVDEDWSTYSVVEHPSGLTPSVDMTKVAGDYPMHDDDYVRPNGSSTDLLKAGIVRIGPYPAIDFNELFASIDDENE